MPSRRMKEGTYSPAERMANEGRQYIQYATVRRMNVRVEKGIKPFFVVVEIMREW